MALAARLASDSSPAQALALHSTPARVSPCTMGHTVPSSTKLRLRPSVLKGRPLRSIQEPLGRTPAPFHSRQITRPGAPCAPRAMWIDNKAEVVADVAVEEAYKLWEDRERIPQWMPWISSVKVEAAKPELSKWTLKWDAFNQNVEINWMARNMQPVLNQKIHWRSVDGLPNRGAVRFFKNGPASCKVEMTISYEVPNILLPFATALGPLVESIIRADLQRFSVYAKKVKAAA